MSDKILLGAYALIFASIGFIAGVVLPPSMLWTVTAIAIIPVVVVAMVKKEVMGPFSWPAVLLPLMLMGSMWATRIYFLGAMNLL